MTESKEGGPPKSNLTFGAMLKAHKGIPFAGISIQKQVHNRLEKRGVLSWRWDIDPTDNCHAINPEFTGDGMKLFFEAQELSKKINCLLCRAQYGSHCTVEKCAFKSKEAMT